jgi:hypothetical protein
MAGLNQLVSEIQSAADYTTPDGSTTSTLGSPSNPTIVVVTGTCSLSGNLSPPGSGILLVQGDVQYVDHPYDGLILAIGTGAFRQSPSRLTTYAAGLSAQLIFITQAAAPADFHPQQQPAREASPAQTQNASPAMRKIKVWTNEDLIATRTPADIYVFEQEARAAAQQAAEFDSVAACFAFDQPTGNVEETHEAIQYAIQDVRDNEAAVAQAKRDLDNSPDNLRLRSQVLLQQSTQDLQKSRAQLKALQDHLQQLNAQQPAQNSSSPDTASPQ